MGSTSQVERPLSMRHAQRWLAAVWASGFLVLFGLLLVTQISDLEVFRNRNSEVWDWFSPLLVPTMSLIVGVLVADPESTSETSRHADRFLFSLALVFSIAYLLAILMVVLSTVWVASIETMNGSSKFLGLLGGVVSAFLGGFFVKKPK